MKPYIQGMITGSVMIFSSIIFMGQTKEKDDLYKKLENQINELYEVTRPKVEDMVESKVDEFIGSRGKYFQNPGLSACRLTKSLYE